MEIKLIQIRKRLILLVAVSFIGSLLFIPFLFAGDPNDTAPIKAAILFSSISTVLIFLTGYAGLLFSDKLNIDMPLLRSWECNRLVDFTRLKSGIFKGVLVGVTVAGLCYVGNRIMHPVPNPGNFLTRISTTVWASVVTESIAHLFVLSWLILLIKNKWVAIIISGLIFVLLFHFNSNYNLTMGLYLGSANFLAATATAYLFVNEGFESAVIAHATMHFIMLAINV
jgi:hypothetical protein